MTNSIIAKSVQDDIDSVIDKVASACGVDPHVDVTVLVNHTDSEGSPPWRVRVYVKSRSASIYKRRSIDGDGNTLEEAANSVVENVIEAVLSGSVKTPQGPREDVVEKFKDRIRKVKEDRDREFLADLAIRAEKMNFKGND